MALLKILPIIILICSSPGSAFYNWETESAKVQMAKDPTIVPVGMGAVFIPAMTTSADEPLALMIQGKETRIEVPLGKITILKPGVYDLAIGSGPISMRMNTQVTISEGHTNVIEPFWATLVVRTVDSRKFPFRGSYELIEMEGKENLGIGIGANEELGERLQSWILKPSTYKILKVGENYRSYLNFFTFRVQKGELLNLTLVADQITGDFLGAGIVDENLQTKVKGDWKYYFTVSGDFLLNTTSNVFGVDDRYLFSSAALYDANLRYDRERHWFLTRLEGEEGLTLQKGIAARKTLDRLRIRSIYIYRYFNWLGPYLRAGADSNLFNQYYFFDAPSDVTIVDSSGSVAGQYSGIEKLKTAPSFSPLSIHEGFGGNFDLINTTMINLYLRTGVGLRQNLTRDLLALTGEGSTTTQVFKRIDNYYLEGHEYTGILDGHLFERLSYNTEFDIFFPFETIDKPIINWISSLNIRLTSFSSLNFLLDAEKDPNIQDETQFDFRVILRFALTLL